jgi:hypothetical protein
MELVKYPPDVLLDVITEHYYVDHAMAAEKQERDAPLVVTMVLSKDLYQEHAQVAMVHALFGKTSP